MRIGFGGRYFSCFDSPLPRVSVGDSIECSAIDEVKGIVRGVVVVERESPSYGYDESMSVYAPFVSYAKDLEADNVLGEVDAVEVVIRLMKRFGTSRLGSMLASYAKDLVLKGMDVEDAMQFVEDAMRKVSAEGAREGAREGA